MAPPPPQARHRSKRRDRATLQRLLLALICGLLLTSLVNAAPVKYRYPLDIASQWTTYRDDKPGSGIIDWNGGNYTYNGHEGTDFAVPKGTPIYAGADGTVEEVIDGKFDDCRSGACSPPSNRVKLRHRDGQITYYLHMKKWSIVVKKGQKVKCGQKIGEVASSGMSTGNHVHFQVGGFRASKEPFKGPKGASSSLWTSQGGYGRRGVVPGKQCDGWTPECNKDSDCKNASKPRCVNNVCVAPPPSGCAFVKTTRLGGLTLNIRASATTSSSKVGSVPENVCLSVLQKTSGQSIQGKTTWYKITYNGTTGWITAAYADCSNCGGVCGTGQTQPCYTGPNGTQGKGICKAGTQTCSGGKWGACTGQITPTTETCDKKDNDCDGQIDEGCPPPGQCKDEDKDGAGIGSTCKGSIDCDDTDPNIHPGAKERCNNQIDDDCDGQIDENCQVNPGCEDQDKDGFKAGAGCPVGVPLDCDDKHPLIYPGAKETCGNNLDEDCDGQDLVCKPMGEFNCLHDGECLTHFCFIRQSTSACSQKCNAGECPAGYTCVENTGCWPAQTSHPEDTPQDKSNGNISLGCLTSQDCPANHTCVRRSCVPKSTPPSQGCGCNTPHTDPSIPALLLGLILLGSLRRRCSQS